MAAVIALSAQKTETVMAPVFEVDPFWPKPLPNHWVTGSTIGVSLDGQYIGRSPVFYWPVTPGRHALGLQDRSQAIILARDAGFGRG